MKGKKRVNGETDGIMRNKEKKTEMERKRNWNESCVLCEMCYGYGPSAFAAFSFDGNCQQSQLLH